MTWLAGCGDSQPPTPSPPADGSQTIRGTERLGWDQVAVSQAELASFRFAIYVDGTRSEMADTSCGAGSSGMFACSGRLPAMTPGAHTLELAAFVVTDGDVVESPRSPPLRVTVSPATTPPPTESAADSSNAVRPVAGARFGVRAVAEGFRDITDLQLTPAGTLYVSEFDGAIYERGDRADPRPALIAGETLIGFALDPLFARTRFVYALQAGDGQDGDRVARLVRYREAGGTFGERAVLLDNLVIAEPRPAGGIRFGPDGKLYLALEEDPALRGRDSERGGRVLRLNPDGTTPADQAGLDPLVVSEFPSPRGFDWQPRSALLWLADAAVDTERLWPVPREARRARQTASSIVYRFEQGTGVRGIAFYRGDDVPMFRGAMFVAGDTGLIRVRFDPRDASRVVATDHLLEGELRRVAVDARGRIFAATATTVYRIIAEREQPND
jgi:glucose/arabinose dehydrogenase